MPRHPGSGKRLPIDLADMLRSMGELKAMPGAYDDVVRLLVPELHRRGLFRKEYAGPTLRENLGLPIPLAADWHAAPRRASE